MNCTSCNNGVLNETLLEAGFWVHTCSSCSGNWILIEDFATWKETNSDYNFSDDISVEETQITDSKKALICPSSGTIMRKFRISATNDHKIDYSSKVGGVWLDNGEWELLKSEGLAGSLNSILTNHWQAKIKQTNTATNFSELYLQKFGSENYKKAKEFREWLINHEFKYDLKAYVLAEDPYSADK